MKQQELKLDVEAFIGLTPYVKTTEAAPPFIGWWQTRREDIPGETPRRWWNGMVWSKPVQPDEWDDEVEYWKKQIAGLEIQPQIEWCGLTEPHPSGYNYPLAASARLWRALQGKFLNGSNKRRKS